MQLGSAVRSFLEEDQGNECDSQQYEDISEYHLVAGDARIVVEDSSNNLEVEHV